MSWINTDERRFYFRFAFIRNQIRMSQDYKQKIRSFEQEQKNLCRRFGVVYQPVDFELRFGVSDNFFSGVLPLNGLRHPPEENMSGWYLWASEEFSDADDLFKPMHIFHLIDRSPNLLKYFALPAGWRFLVAGDYEDVWFDASLLNI